ncbi:pilus assembly protein TadG-related protein [Methylobacterium organophilum]|uniref:TadG family pilus assembly protein n=1 Tax=Methylobacterium organophilum TaxID=410 RepID=UPI001F129D06|nr:TadG family pilus assembly protein [Methylobacterium organophilum]UMY15668.1 pilus assembly protein TadG-related protein [Methylobacterium organophilum]
MPLRKLFPRRSFTQDRHGSVAVFGALGMTAILGAAAIGVDLGALYGAKRRAQGAVDLAASLAAADPSAALGTACRSLADNGYADCSKAVVLPGTYSAESGSSAASRFQPGGKPPNAVRVTLTAAAKTLFAPVLGLPSSFPVTAEGTAATARFGAFTIGSGLVSLDGGIANALLGALLGAKLSLSAMDYDALLNSRVDTFRFLDALANSLSLQAASYNDVISANASVGQILTALSASVPGAGAAAALSQVRAAASASAGRINVAQVLDLGDAGALAPGRGSRGPSVGTYDLLSAAVAAANGTRQVSVDLGLTIPGLTRTRVTVAVGERRQSSGWVQPNSPRATVRTAQTRVLIEAGLTAPLGLGTLSLPVYAEAAYGQATLRSVSCPWTESSARSMSLDVRPGAVDLAIANVPASAIDGSGAAPNLSQPAELLRLALPPLVITGRARTTIGPSNSQTVTFSADDIARNRVRTVSSTGLVGSATASLLASLSLELNGLGVLSLPTLKPLTLAVLNTAAPAIDLVLDNTLRALGIRIGSADVSADGVRCDQAVLVQ